MQQETFEEVRDRAEDLIVSGRYAEAAAAYRALDPRTLMPSQERWVRFRLVDCQWRAESGSRNSGVDSDVTELTELVDDPSWSEHPDDDWATACASLAELLDERRGIDAAAERYEAALAYWERSSDLEKARREFLGLLARYATADSQPNRWIFQSRASRVPRELLRKAVRIARDPADQARMRFLLATAYANDSGNFQSAERARRAYESVIELGRGLPYYDWALFQLAQHLQSPGRPEAQADGTRAFQPDHVGALALYRRILSEFEEGETPVYGQAVEQIQWIHEESLGLSVPGKFLPGTPVRYRLETRNLPEVRLALVPIELASAVQLDVPYGDWLAAVNLEALAPLRTWSVEPPHADDHRADALDLDLGEPLPPGAYVLAARGGALKARELILVSDLALTVKSAPDRVLVWATNVLTGEPVADASVTLRRRWGRGKAKRMETVVGTTDEDGLCLLSIRAIEDDSSLVCSAVRGDRQAVVEGWSPEGQDPRSSATLAFSTETDRPAYRPGQTVHWKLLARHRTADGLTTPEGESLDYVIVDPQGNDWKKGRLQLDAFGAAWGELETTPDQALGTYAMRLVSGGRWLSSSRLFVLEDYELPEFEVSVEPRTAEDGTPLRFAPGDTLEADVVASYTSGGPVRGARVEVFVRKVPYGFHPVEPDPLPWFSRATRWNSPYRGHRSAGLHLWDEGFGHGRWPSWAAPEEVAHEVLSTDESGRAHLSVDTGFDDAGDFEYRIEARVTDASRREIRGTGSVLATRTPFFVQLSPHDRILAPETQTGIDVRATTPDGRGVRAKGTLELYRRTTVCRWVDPVGGRHTTRGDARPDSASWRIVSREEEEALVRSDSVETDADGTASWRLRTGEPGVYVVRWRSPGDRELDVTAETSFVVAGEGTKRLGVTFGGLELLVNDSTIAPGGEATLVVLAPEPGRTVLLTTECWGLDSWRVLRMSGTVEVVRLPVTEEHVPGLWVSVVSLYDGQVSYDEAVLDVPPVASVLDVTLTPNAEEVRPGEDATYTVSVRDADGEPVEAQLSLAVIDATVLSVQEDLGGDPRRQFLSGVRSRAVRTVSSPDRGAYLGPPAEDEGAARPGEGGGAGRYRGPGDTTAPGAANRDMLESLGYGGEVVAEEGVGAEGFYLGKAVMRDGGDGDPDFDSGASGPRLRSDFRETALWIPDVVTDADGRATIELHYPDTTTRWRAYARGATRGARFGVGEATTRTSLPLTARLAVPRFLIAGDEATLSCNFVNETDSPLTLAVGFEVEGVERLGGEDASELEVPAREARRLDWRVAAKDVGEAVVRVRARAQGDASDLGDAIERRIPIRPHGIVARVQRTGRFRGESWSFDLDLPAARDHDTTECAVQVTPSLAVTMLDALPYLADYPYGCTEQTLSRFVPSVIVRKTLSGLGLEPDEALARRFGGIEEEHEATTHGGKERSFTKLDDMVRAGLARLVSLQHGDGGFGWWKDDRSQPYLTAYALWSLSLARDAGIDIQAGVLQGAARYLANHLVEQSDLDLLAFELFALASYGGPNIDTGNRTANRWIEEGFERLRAKPGRTSPYGSALWALAAHRTGNEAEARATLALLMNGVVFDEEPDTSILQGGKTDAEHALRTAHWGQDSFYSWRDGAIESTAFAILALNEIDPANSLLEPAVTWLVQNRRGAQWTNTRDTAISVLALSQVLAREGIGAGELGFTVEVNGTRVGDVHFTAEELLRAPSRFPVDTSLLRDGANTVRITRTSGEAPLLVSAWASFFSREEPIPARGATLFVRRSYERLVPRPTLLAGTVYDRVPLRDGDRIESGDRVESILLVEVKNDLEYVLLEDLLPAGLHTVATKSGSILIQAMDAEHLPERRGKGARTGVIPEPAGYGEWGHRELRADRTAIFVTELGAGLWQVRTMLVARTPGTFHALPLLGEAMYVPEIRCNSRELRLGVDSGGS